MSLTSIPCKIMESIIKEKITGHLDQNKLIKTTQHGFQKGKSCATNLILTMEYLTKATDRNIPVDLIYLDFSKAFDKVPHIRLVAKLKAKGIDGEVLQWLEKWLKDRTQKVKVNQDESEEAEVRSGVPQGTILGPPLFNVYIDDIDDCAEELAEILKFADDTKIFKTVQNEQDRNNLQTVLDRLCAWAERWGMSFNTEKCKVMHVGHNNNKFTYYMQGQALGTTDSERDLGVIVESSLKPSAQCKKAAAKAKTVLHQITRNFHYRDKKHFIGLYKQYVRPHLEFSSSAWAPWTATDIQILEKVQEQAIRYTVGLKGRTYEEKCKEIGLETLEKRRVDQDMMQVFKITKGFDKVEPNTLFSRVDTSMRTRINADPLNLKKERANKEVRANSFSLRVVDNWNRIPSEAKEREKPAGFKNYLKRK